MLWDTRESVDHACLPAPSEPCHEDLASALGVAGKAPSITVVGFCKIVCFPRDIPCYGQQGRRHFRHLDAIVGILDFCTRLVSSTKSPLAPLTVADRKTGKQRGTCVCCRQLGKMLTAVTNVGNRETKYISSQGDPNHRSGHRLRWGRFLSTQTFRFARACEPRTNENDPSKQKSKLYDTGYSCASTVVSCREGRGGGYGLKVVGGIQASREGKH